MSTQASNSDICIWWIKRDFRLFDNAALTAAVQSDVVLPLFIIEPGIWNGPDASVFHRKAQAQALQSLQKELHKQNADLMVASGRAIDVLDRLRTQFGVQRIVSHEEVGLNHTYARDKRVQKWCREHNVAWEELCFQGVIRGLGNRDNRLDKFNNYIDRDLLSVPENIPAPDNIFSGWPQSIRDVLQSKPEMQKVTHGHWSRCTSISGLDGWCFRSCFC